MYKNKEAKSFRKEGVLPEVKVEEMDLCMYRRSLETSQRTLSEWKPGGRVPRAGSGHWRRRGAVRTILSVGETWGHLRVT